MFSQFHGIKIIKANEVQNVQQGLLNHKLTVAGIFLTLIFTGFSQH